MAREWTRRTYTGSAEEPITWDQLLVIFDSMFGEDTRTLKKFPESLHDVAASWTDGGSITYDVDSLNEIKDAYENKKTAGISFHGRRQSGRDCIFRYLPGQTPPIAFVQIEAHPSEVESKLEEVRRIFPIQRQFVFLSWSGNESKAVAGALAPIINARLPIGAEVFFSDTDIPLGDDPLKTLLEDRLLPAAVQIPVLTATSHDQPWLVWETASAWALQRRVIPLFVDIQPDDVAGPVHFIRQGVQLKSKEDLDQLVEAVVQHLGAEAAEPVTQAEFASIPRRDRRNSSSLVRTLNG